MSTANVNKIKKSHCVKSVRIRICLVRIFPHLDWIRVDMEYLSIVSPNVGKYGPENSEYEHFSRSECPAQHFERTFRKQNYFIWIGLLFKINK